MERFAGFEMQDGGESGVWASVGSKATSKKFASDQSAGDHSVVMDFWDTF